MTNYKKTHKGQKTTKFQTKNNNIHVYYYLCILLVITTAYTRRSIIKIVFY